MLSLLEYFQNNSGKYAKDLKFTTLVIFMLTIIIFTIFFRHTYVNVIILIAVSLWIAQLYFQHQRRQVQDTNQDIMHKLLKLQEHQNMFISQKIKQSSYSSSKIPLSQTDINKIYKKYELDSLFIDATIILFLYSILPLSNYNPQEFFSLLNGVNNILKIRKDIEIYHNQTQNAPENISQLFEIALDLRKNTINNMYNFIYTVPKMNRSYDYLSTAVERFMVLITRNTDAINQHYKYAIEKGITNSTKFVSYKTTKPYDASLTTKTQFFI